VASARGQQYELLQKPIEIDSDAVDHPPQDANSMRLFLLDCTDAARSSRTMLRFRRSISALAPDISLAAITIFCKIPEAACIPAPVIDVDKVTLAKDVCICHPLIALTVNRCVTRNHFVTLPPFQIRFLLSQLQQPSSSASGNSAPTIIVHPQAHQLLEHMQVSRPIYSSLVPPRFFFLF
jgi:hypothetical protein